MKLFIFLTIIILVFILIISKKQQLKESFQTTTEGPLNIEIEDISATEINRGFYRIAGPLYNNIYNCLLNSDGCTINDLTIRNIYNLEEISFQNINNINGKVTKFIIIKP